MPDRSRKTSRDTSGRQSMKRSTERFLTTHTGSPPRPEDLVRMMYAREEGVPVDRAELGARIHSAVEDVVHKQAAAGVDIVNDGEMSKPSYATYVKDRLNGFGGTGNTFVYQDLVEFPNLAMGRHIQYANLSLDEFRKKARLHVEALNHALADIPPEQLRMHLCWGNYEGPHHCDVPLADIIDIVFLARPSAISFEAANPRHAHEWKLFETVKLPEGKVLIPGVLESKTNFIEHPELVAQRIGRYAKLVGRENVIAGSDCGYGTWVGQAAVDPDVVWAKMAAMTEGARIATREFWKR